MYGASYCTEMPTHAYSRELKCANPDAMVVASSTAEVDKQSNLMWRVASRRKEFIAGTNSRDSVQRRTDITRRLTGVLLLCGYIASRQERIDSSRRDRQ
jgi:hypothetical protein